MKIISTKLHGIFDYSSGLILLLPWITNFNQSSADTQVLAALGAMTIFLSLLTDYEFGLIKLLPMKVHLILDVCQAALLIATPWMFPVRNYAFYWPVVLGVAELIIIVLSSSKPYQVTRRDLDITKP